jgi:predicted peroxiredoxin
MFGQAKASFLVSNPREQRICTIGEVFRVLKSRIFRAKKPLKIMMKNAWGPDDPTRAAFPFAHGLVLAEAGHEVQIFLLAEATSLLRKSMVNAILPVGWPPLSETLEKVVAKHIPIFA